MNFIASIKLKYLTTVAHRTGTRKKSHVLLQSAYTVGGMIKYYLKVNKLKIYIVNPGAQVGKLQPTDQVWFTVFSSYIDKGAKSILLSALVGKILLKDSHPHSCLYLFGVKMSKLNSCDRLYGLQILK